MAASEYQYTLLTVELRESLLRDRLRRIEAEHFNVGLEVKLAALVGDTDQLDSAAQIELAGLEVKASALRAWLGIKETTDA